MFFRLLSRLPLPVLHALSSTLAFVLYRVLGYRKKVVKSNLQRAFPNKTNREINRLAAAFYTNLTDVVVETLKAMTISEAAIKKRARITNPEVAEAWIAQNKSFIALAAHQANWEWLLLACCVQLSCPIDAVYMRINNKYFEKLVYNMRSRFGGRPILRKDTLMEIMKRKKVVRGFGMNADQAPLVFNEKYWTSFLGTDTAFHLGIETVARMTKYPVLFLGIKRVKRGYYEITFHEVAQPPYPKDEFKVTEQYARLVEQQVLAAPESYLWSHKRWKYPRPVYE